MKVSEIVKITKKIRKMEKLKSRLLSTLTVITALFGIGILGTLFLFGTQWLIISFVLIKWLIAITVVIWLLISVLQIKTILEKRNLYFNMRINFWILRL